MRARQLEPSISSARTYQRSVVAEGLQLLRSLHPRAGTHHREANSLADDDGTIVLRHALHGSAARLIRLAPSSMAAAI